MRDGVVRLGCVTVTSVLFLAFGVEAYSREWATAALAIGMANLLMWYGYATGRLDGISDEAQCWLKKTDDDEPTHP